LTNPPKALVNALLCVAIVVTGIGATSLVWVRYSAAKSASDEHIELTGSERYKALATATARAALTFQATMEQAVNAANGNHAAPPANVAVQVLEPVTVKDALNLTGTLAPWKGITLSAEVAGKVEVQGVEEGDVVRTGQELFRIDTEVIRARLDQARAQSRLAKQELDRFEKLSKAGISTGQSLDVAEADYDVAEATLRTLQIELEKSVLNAPFDGVVDTVFREADEFVDMGAPLVRLVQIDKLKLLVGIPERDIRFFKEGDAVQISLDAFPSKTFTGTIYRIATSAEEATRTFIAEVQLDNRDGRLRPGMIAHADFARHVFEDALVAPIFAIRSEEGKRYVYVAEDGRAVRREVEVGMFQEGGVHVTEGLSTGDRLIVKGQYAVHEGEPVAVREKVQ